MRFLGVGASTRVKDDGSRMTRDGCFRVIDRSFFPCTEQGQMGALSVPCFSFSNPGCWPQCTHGVPFTQVGILEVSRHRDDTAWSGHLQLEVGIVPNRHELGVAWLPEYGAIGSLEVNNFKRECLLLVVYPIAE